MIYFLKKNYIIIIILAVGFILRALHPLQLFQYGHDQDLAGWFVRDVLVNHHLRLIGQETSSHGIFIGPYFYYLLIPFYVLLHMDPSGSILLSIILGTFAVFSVYFVFEKMFGKRTALTGAAIYALSVLIIFTDREVDPTMPVMLWSIWFLFALFSILKNKNYGYLIVGLLVGLIWSINLQLIILLPLILVAQFFSKRKIVLKEIFVGITIAIVLNIPFMAFEVRHGFQQVNSLISSLTTNKDYVAGTATGIIAKLDRTMQLVYKNTSAIFLGNNIFNIPVQFMFYILITSFVFLSVRIKTQRKLFVILFLWLVIYVLFFSKVALNLSEYYLNGMNVVYILIAAFGITELIKNTKLKKLGYFLMVLFMALNLYSYFTRPVNANGYLERKAIIQHIKEDSLKHGFPCVSLSFVTSPGNDLGYRYFTWELGLKTKPVSNEVPVYTIVFPLNIVGKFDKSFGALGLVLPDYKRYNDSVIQKACEGSDYTTVQPMFGFTN